MTKEGGEAHWHILSGILHTVVQKSTEVGVHHNDVILGESLHIYEHTLTPHTQEPTAFPFSNRLLLNL